MTASVRMAKVFVEYGINLDLPATKYALPAILSRTSSAIMLMVHPMFCGSLLYRFFGAVSQSWIALRTWRRRR